MFYRVREKPPSSGDGAIPWQDIPAVMLGHHMGPRPDHFPRTEVRLCYDPLNIYVGFRVEDRYVRAVTAEHQGEVWTDSCVEFFFSPGPDLSRGYFNIEMNCGATMLFHFQAGPGRAKTVIPRSECEKISRSHSLPLIVDPEIISPVIWTVEYAVPITLLKVYGPMHAPAPGIIWRGNFAKCADHTSHPHWLTWSPIDFPRPDFHRPDFFGTLEFI